MDKRSFASKIGHLSSLLLILNIHVRPYEKNFILRQDVSEYTIERISKISKSTITFDIKEEWIEKRLVSLLSAKKEIRYNLLLMGDLSEMRIKNIRQLLPMRVGYTVDKFITSQKILELERLPPSFIFLIFKRLPEPFELDLLSKGRIREITIMLDKYSVEEFIKRRSDFSNMRLTIKPLDIGTLEYLCSMGSDTLINTILIDSRILNLREMGNNILIGCWSRMIYEISSSTFYDDFLLFMKAGIDRLNIYMSTTASRNDIIDWIRKTDP